MELENGAIYKDTYNSISVVNQNGKGEKIDPAKLDQMLLRNLKYNNKKLLKLKNKRGLK